MPAILALNLSPDLLWVVPLIISLAALAWWLRARSVARPLAVALRRLEQASGRCRDSASDLASQGQAQVESLRQQAETASGSLAAVGEMASVASQAAEAATEAADLSHSARSATSQASLDLDGLLAHLTRSRSQIADTAGSLQAVQEMTVQANLIALSVAVQAARAGEAGESLLQMAEELRQMALRAGEAVRGSAGKVQQCLQQNRVAEESATGLRLTLGEIDAAGSRVLRLTHELAIAEKEQAGELRQLQQLLAQSAEGLDRTTSEARQQAKGADEVSVQAGQVASTCRKLAAEYGAATPAEAPAPQGLPVAVMGR